jgi:hypothetical protein
MKQRRDRNHESLCALLRSADSAPPVFPPRVRSGPRHYKTGAFFVVSAAA